MKDDVKLKEGQKLIFIGKNFEIFDTNDPLIFLGYDSNGWKDIWVDYQGKKILISIEDVEIA